MSGRSKNWLHGLAYEGDGARYPCTRDVFPLTLNERTYSVVTDTKSALAIEDDGRLVTRWPPGEEHDYIGRLLQRSFTAPTRDVRSTRLADLKAWLPPVDPDEEKPPIGVVGGKEVDGMLLQQFLPVELFSLTETQDPVCGYGATPMTADPHAAPIGVAVIGPRWRLILMSLVDEEKTGPHPIYLPRLGALWHARHTTAGRERIADFYAENGEADYAAHVRSNPFPW